MPFWINPLTGKKVDYSSIYEELKLESRSKDKLERIEKNKHLKNNKTNSDLFIPTYMKICVFILFFILFKSFYEHFS